MPGRGKRGRKRHKSSPGGKPSQKKQKAIQFPDYTADSEGEGTDYFDTFSDSEALHPGETTPPTTDTETPSTSVQNMAPLSPADISDMCKQLIPTLVQELKQALKDDILRDIKNENRDLIKRDIRDVIREENEYLKGEITGLKKKVNDLDSEVDKLKTTVKLLQLEQDELAQLSGHIIHSRRPRYA